MAASSPESRPFHYVEFAPGDAVRDIALTYWGFTVRALPHPGFLHRVWPDGCMSLVLARIGGRVVAARVSGPRDEPLDIPVFPGACYWGIRFRPESGARWLGASAEDLRDRSEAAETLLGAPVESLGTCIAPFAATDAPGATDGVAALFDEWLLHRPLDAGSIDGVVRDAVAHIVASDGLRPIADIALACGTSMRSLQRRFRTATGLTPKEFARVRRGRAAVKRVVHWETGPDAGGWPALADEAGYADQSHLAREFARLTQLTPRALQKRLETIEHGDIVD